MSETKPGYDVAVEDGGLNWEKAGPLFDRYCVGLSGRIDRRWADCYQKITVAMPTYSRFRLEPGTASVTFTCRSTDGPVEVMGVLKRLEDLLQKVNREATAELATKPPETPIRPTTTVSAGGGGQPQGRVSGLAAGLMTLGVTLGFAFPGPSGTSSSSPCCPRTP